MGKTKILAAAAALLLSSASAFAQYVDPATGEYLKGWQMIKGEIYYFDPSTGYMKRYFQIIDGCHYFFGKEGTLRQDTFFKMYRLTYYSHPDGQIKAGFFELDGNLYYSTHGAGGDNPPGPLAINTLFFIGGEHYYFDENFTAVSGWLEFKSRWYYFDSVTKKGYKDGWYEINGKEYYFDADAICAVDCVKEFVIETNGYRYSEYYRFDKDGQIVKGWYLDESNDTWYYYDETTGEAKTGWFQYKNDWYYSYKDGRCAKEEIIMTTKGDSYVGSDYKCKYGWIPLTIDGKTYYMYANTSGYLVEGWKTINGKDYYFYSSYSEKPYTMAFNTTIDDHYINNSGVRVS